MQIFAISNFTGFISYFGNAPYIEEEILFEAFYQPHSIPYFIDANATLKF